MPRFWSWQSCEFSVAREGQPAKIHTHIRSISYSDSVESELVKGAGRGVLGTTDPTYTPGDMSFDLLARWFRVFAADATNDGEIELGELDFTLILKRQSRSELNAGDPAITDKVDFQIVGADDSGESGSPAPQVTTVSCLPTRIERNGVVL